MAGLGKVKLNLCLVGGDKLSTCLQNLKTAFSDFAEALEELEIDVKSE